MSFRVCGGLAYLIYIFWVELMLESMIIIYTIISYISYNISQCQYISTRLNGGGILRNPS